MWSKLLVSAAALVAFAAPAAAETVSIRPASYAPDYMEELEETYGLRESDAINAMVTSALRTALENVDATVADTGALTIETTVIDAKPNKPTFQQLIDEPGLDYARSFGVGGATLHGVLRGPDGAVLQEIDYRWYETDISWAASAGQWSDARRAIRRYADRVAAAVAARGG
ncbi:MAG: hypothetical protein NW203_08055 [Hyphomonadaceae bacterium]|nr:hypothetical protein [Hyphomonadaceae bacterium]